MNSINRSLSLRAAFFVLTLTAGASALASAGRTPIYQPIVITQPGAYYVSRDFTASSGPAIDVQSDNVEIALEGHIITQSNPSIAVIAAAGRKGLSVTGPGRLKGGGYGIHVDSPSGGGTVRIKGVTIESARIGIRLDGECSCCYITSAEIQDNTIYNAGPYGMLVDSVDALSIERNVVTGADAVGVSTNCIDSQRMTDNVINSTGNTGYSTGNNNSLVFSGNSITMGPNASGAYMNVTGAGNVFNNSIIGVTPTGAGTSGIIYYGVGGQLVNNSVRGFETSIHIPDQSIGNTVYRNSCTGATNGILVYGDLNTFDNNILTGNSVGLNFTSLATGNVYSGNRANSLYVINPGNTNGGSNF